MMAAFRERLSETLQYFEQRADADQPSGDASPTPNAEMTLQMEVEGIIRDGEQLLHSAKQAALVINELCMKFGYNRKDSPAFMDLMAAISKMERRQ